MAQCNIETGSDPIAVCTVTHAPVGVNPRHRVTTVISFIFSHLYNGAALATGVVT